MFILLQILELQKLVVWFLRYVLPHTQELLYYLLVNPGAFQQLMIPHASRVESFTCRKEMPCKINPRKTRLGLNKNSEQ